MIFPNRSISLQMAIKDQKTTIEIVITSEEKEIDSDCTGRSFEKVQVSKAYQYIEDKVVEIVTNLQIYIDVQ